MQIKIPFTSKFFEIGTKEAVKQPFKYGAWQNLLGDMFTNGGFRMSFDTLYTIYNNVVDVKQSIRKLSSANMKAGYTIINKNKPDGIPDAKEVAILESVLSNKKQTFNILKSLWTRDLGVAGNVYWLILKNKAGKALGLQNIDPRTMVIVSDEFGNVKRYIQRVQGKDAQIFSTDEIIHTVMDYSTEKSLLGVSPIEAIIWDSKSEMSATTANLAFYENNGVPAHLLITEEELSEEQYKSVKSGVDKQYKGAKNKFKAGLIPFVKDIKTIAPSQKEMQYIESRMFNTKKVVVAFGVDSFILGYTEKVQRGNADVIYRGFYENTVRDYELLFQEMVNKELLEKLGLKNIKFVANISNYDNKEKVLANTREDVKNGIITINEARKARGLEPSDNEFADELMIGGILLDDLGAETQEVFNAVKQQLDLKHKKMMNLLDE